MQSLNNAIQLFGEALPFIALVERRVEVRLQVGVGIGERVAQRARRFERVSQRAHDLCRACGEAGGHARAVYQLAHR